jgi:hypothetical protein
MLPSFDRWLSRVRATAIFLTYKAQRVEKLAQITRQNLLRFGQKETIHENTRKTTF